MALKVLIGTPAFGGLISTGYLTSMVTTVQGLMHNKVDFAVYTLANESLIQRGRNDIAHHAVENGYDMLVFIDADISWTWDDFAALLNSNKPVVGGVYALKTFPLMLNFNPLPPHFDVFETVGPNGLFHQKTPEKFQEYKKKYADEKGEVEVIHIPTGFMRIHKSVFALLKDKVGFYTRTDLHTGAKSKVANYFQVGERNDVLESEDWWFCTECRKNNVPIYLNTNVIVPHAGSYVFNPHAPRLFTAEEVQDARRMEAEAACKVSQASLDELGAVLAEAGKVMKRA